MPRFRFQWKCCNLISSSSYGFNLSFSPTLTDLAELVQLETTAVSLVDDQNASPKKAQVFKSTLVPTIAARVLIGMVHNMVAMAFVTRLAPVA